MNPGTGSRLLRPETASWRQLYEQARARLAGGHATQEVRWLVEEASGEPWAVLYDQPEAVGSRRERLRLESMVERRLAGEPLQYVLGRWNFRTLDLMVDPRVLIPRPETEQVVERALAELDRLGRPDARVVDLGTGSGAIALSIAAERTNVQVWATDASSEALDVARANLAGLGGFPATRVNLVQGHWWAALPESLIGSVHLAVSNPPYVSSVEVGSLDAGIVDWEPRIALEAGPTGLEALREIVSRAPEWLAPEGSLVLEMAPHQREAMTVQALAAGFAEVEVLPDLAGLDRVLVGAPDAHQQTGTMTVLVPAHGDPPPEQAISAAADALRDGDIIGVPTDTVYGLAADPWRSGASDRLFLLKGRPRSVELPLIVADIEQALELTTAVPPSALRLMETFWPGRLTLVLPRRPDVNADLGEEDATIGLRCPGHPVTQALCRLVGPFAATSANRHGEPPATSAKALAEQLPGVALVLDAGDCAGLPSTVVDSTGPVPRLLREGSVDWEQIQAAVSTP